MDLHAGQVQGFFEIPVDHMTAVPMFAQYVRDLNLDEGLAVVSPDTGHAKIAGKFAEMVGGDLVILNKVRPAHNEATVTTVIGDVDGKVAVIIDDIVDTAGTLVAGAKALKDAGATKVYACATHGLFNGPALERIADSDIHRLVVTDTVPLDPRRQPDNIQVLSIASILAETILERLLRRLGLGDLRRRESALLADSLEQALGDAVEHVQHRRPDRLGLCSGITRREGLLDEGCEELGALLPEQEQHRREPREPLCDLIAVGLVGEHPLGDRAELVEQRLVACERADRSGHQSLRPQKRLRLVELDPDIAAHRPVIRRSGRFGFRRSEAAERCRRRPLRAPPV